MDYSLRELIDYNLQIARDTLDQVPGGPRILGAILLFVVGWLIARVVLAVLMRLLRRLDLDGFIVRRLGVEALADAHKEDPHRFERVLGRILYYGLLVFLAIGILEVLGLTSVSTPLMTMLTEITAAVPDVLKAAVIIVVAWGLASVLRAAVRQALERLSIDKRLSQLQEENVEAEDLARQHELTLRLAGDGVFYAVLLLGVAPALGALGLDELASPVRSVVDSFLAIVPRAFGAALMLLIGWIAARIARQAVSTLLSAGGFDDAAKRVGFDKVFASRTASEVVAALAYWLILIPVAVSAIDTLRIEGLSGPLSDVLTMVLGQIPNILVAIAVILVAVVAGRWIGDLLTGLAETLGADGLLARVGIGNLTLEGDRRPSAVIGTVGRVLVVLFGVLQGLRIVGLDALADLLMAFLRFLPSVGVAVLILGVGLVLGTWVKGLIDEHLTAEGSELWPRFLGVAARVIIIVFTGLIASQELGLAEELVRQAFSILFGAFCLALALAFGLGARETAGDLVKEQVEKARARQDKPGA